MPEEPSPAAYEPEWRLEYRAASPSGPHVVFSGNVSVGLKGKKDEHFHEYEVHLIVGPWWKAVRQVVPHVTVAGYSNSNADEDDQQGWSIHGLAWDAVSGPPGPNVDEERIRLKLKVSVKGENSNVFRLAYHVVANGRLLGKGGLMSPPPAHAQEA